MIYVLNFIVTLLLAFITQYLYKYNKNKYIKIIFFSFTFIFIFIIYSMRGNVGIDYDQYLRIYNNISYYNINSFDILKEISNTWDVEPGFIVINMISNKLGIGIQGVYIFTTIIFMLFFLKALDYYDSKKENLSFILLIFLSQLFFKGMDAVRQFIAIMIFFYSTKFIVEKNFIKYILFILLGSIFHESILFLIPLYFINKINFNKINFIILVVLSIIFSKFLTFDYMINIIAKILPNMGYIKYIGRDVTYTGTLGIVYLIYFILALFMLNNIRKINKKNDLLSIKFYLLYVLLFPYFSSSLSLVRILVYINIFIIIAIPIYSKYINRTYRFLYIMFFVCLFTLLFITSLKGAYCDLQRNIIPYEFFFN
ncbi:EpsG family protein [Clostridium perfringens]|nr:EpsG family protein [Clostridium perfringens]